ADLRNEATHILSRNCALRTGGEQAQVEGLGGSPPGPRGLRRASPRSVPTPIALRPLFQSAASGPARRPWNLVSWSSHEIPLPLHRLVPGRLQRTALRLCLFSSLREAEVRRGRTPCPPRAVP